MEQDARADRFRAASCCGAPLRRSVSELCDRGLRRNRLEPLAIAGRAVSGRDGLAAQFSLERRGALIAAVRFKASTCATLLAYCELVAELATMRALRECAAITPQRLLAELPGVPALKRDRALLAARAFQSALSEVERASVG